MRFVLFLSVLASGPPGLPCGVAAPLPSTNSLSLKERNSKPLNLERGFSTLSSSARGTVHSPSSKRDHRLPPSVWTSIATSPIIPTETNKRRESPSTDPLPNTVKRSKGTPCLTRRRQKDSAVEAKSPTAAGEEPKEWSGLGSRSSDAGNTNSNLAIRANNPSTPDSAKDPDYNKKNGYWAPMEPVYHVLIGIGIVLAILLVNLLVRCLVGGKDTVKYLKTWQGTMKKSWERKAERRTAKNEVVTPA